jgi:hypothetical protein
MSLLIYIYKTKKIAEMKNLKELFYLIFFIKEKRKKKLKGLGWPTNHPKRWLGVAACHPPLPQKIHYKKVGIWPPTFRDVDECEPRG